MLFVIMNHIRMIIISVLKYEFVLEDSKDDSNKGFSVTDTDYYTRKIKGTLGEIVETIINKHGFESMILDFT